MILTAVQILNHFSARSKIVDLKTFIQLVSNFLSYFLNFLIVSQTPMVLINANMFGQAKHVIILTFINWICNQ